MRNQKQLGTRVLVGVMTLLFVFELQSSAIARGIVGWFGSSRSEIIPLWSVDDVGDPVGPLQDSLFSSAYVHCRSGKLVVSAAGRVNNWTVDRHTSVCLWNHPEVNNVTLGAALNFAQTYCPDFGGVDAEYSKYYVSRDRTPGDFPTVDNRARGLLTYVAKFNTNVIPD